MRIPRSRFRSLRGACIVAGSLFFCAVVSPAAEEDPPPVKFAAWNLRNYLHTVTVPANFAPRDTRPKPPDEVAAITRILVSLQPDIAGMCEIGGQEDFAALQHRLKEAGLDLPHAELVQSADVSRHLGLLSRYPIIERHPQTALSYQLDDSKLPVQRGFLDVTVAITGTYHLRLIGTHLKSKREVPEANEALMRRNEAHLLRQYVDSVLTAEPAANLLVYGDFNDTRDLPAVRAIRGTMGANGFLTEITPVDIRGTRWTYYFPEADTYSRIDFLLASKSLVPEVEAKQSLIYSGDDWFSASDHRALTTVIRPGKRVRRARGIEKPASRTPKPKGTPNDE